jgi:intergrase/recombinase
LYDVVIEDTDDLIEISLTVSKGWNWYAKAVRNIINYCVERRIIDKSKAIELKEF